MAKHTSVTRIGCGVLLATILSLGGTANSGAQDEPPLTNADIIRLVSAKLGDGIILATIEASPRRAFDLGVDSLIALKQAGASDSVIAAMQKAAAAHRPVVRPSPQPSAAAPLVVAPSRPAAPLPSTSAPVVLRQPTEAFKVMRVDLTTGELLPLEPANVKTPRWSSVKRVWLEGTTSPVTFKYGEKLGFALLLTDTLDKLQREKEKKWAYQIEPLAEKDGRRYASRAANILFNIEPYGEPKAIEGRKGRVPAYTYLLTPRSQLPPGQYAFTMGGMFDGFTLGAFGVVP
jgi:hypothetical protein